MATWQVPCGPFKMVLKIKIWSSVLFKTPIWPHVPIIPTFQSLKIYNLPPNVKKNFNLISHNDHFTPLKIGDFTIGITTSTLSFNEIYQVVSTNCMAYAMGNLEDHHQIWQIISETPKAKAHLPPNQAGINSLLVLGNGSIWLTKSIGPDIESSLIKGICNKYITFKNCLEICANFINYNTLLLYLFLHRLMLNVVQRIALMRF